MNLETDEILNIKVKNLEARKDFYWWKKLEENNIPVGESSFWYDEEFVKINSDLLPYKLKKKIAIDAARMRYRLGIDQQMASIGKKRKHGKLGKVLGRTRPKGDVVSPTSGVSGAISAAVWFRKISARNRT